MLIHAGILRNILGSEKVKGSSSPKQETSVGVVNRRKVDLHGKRSSSTRNLGASASSSRYQNHRNPIIDDVTPKFVDRLDRDQSSEESISGVTVLLGKQPGDALTLRQTVGGI